MASKSRPDTTTRRVRSVAADFITGVEALAAYARFGTPKVVSGDGPDPAPTELAALLRNIEPRDLPGGFSALWAAGRPRWSQGECFSLNELLRDVPSDQRPAAEGALAFARAHGMHVAFQARPNARRLLMRSEALQRWNRSMGKAAEAWTDAEKAVGDVVA